MAISPIFGMVSPPPSSDQEDPFLGFVEYARSTLASTSGDSGGEPMETSQGGDQPPWCWVVSRILKTCAAYPSGVTAAILLSDLFQVNNLKKIPIYLRTALEIFYNSGAWFF